MTDDVFEDLVNLYLDREISSAQLQILRDELERNPPRRKVFESYCRMHQASHFAALSARPVIPTLNQERTSLNGKPALFAFNRQVWAAALLMAVLGTFATLYLNGPFGSARIVKLDNLEKIDTFSQNNASTAQPPLEFFRALKAQSQSADWSYAQELRHARAIKPLENEEIPPYYGLNQRLNEMQSELVKEPEFDLEFSSYEFKR